MSAPNDSKNRGGILYKFTAWTEAFLRRRWFSPSVTDGIYYQDQAPNSWVGSIDFRAFTPVFAFVLNALITAFAVAGGYEIRESASVPPGARGFGIIFAVTLGIGVAAYYTFYCLFLFGGVYALAASFLTLMHPHKVV
jgi:hypothetical protein